LFISLAGGSDDGLNCAVMLEVLEVLSRSETSLKHNVIFLFNGAEESPLQVRDLALARMLLVTELV
jgi:acetylornithine deacetylase/succinyl-diaminopimelate desuccinylase-like protein